jgi:ubiquinone biosynthesis protein
MVDRLSSLESFRRTLNHIFNRIVLALIVSSLLIGSLIMVRSGLPPLVSGIPIIGLAGFTITALPGIWLIISVLRNGINLTCLFPFPFLKEQAMN